MHIFVKRNKSINNTADADAATKNTNEKAIFKNGTPFTDCINKINNTQVDNAKDIDIVILIGIVILFSSILHTNVCCFWCTARKTIFSFAGHLEKMVFPKKIALEYHLSCTIEKDDISFSQKYELTPWTENER